MLKVISRYSMLARGDRVVAAVSGGPDSVCLLHVLLEVAPRFEASVAGIAHVNHKLRGEASQEDERFVAAIAARARVPFFRIDAPIESGNIEQSARLKRREFFSRLMKDGDATKIALGHTRDDQAETVLFRLLRGAGLSGLAGIHPVSANGLIRPLIDVTRAEIVEYLTNRQIAWREDASNTDLRFARNRIRHQLLPQFAREWNPNIVDALAQLGELAFEEERCWQQTLPEASTSLSALELAQMPRAAARRVVRRAIQAAKGDLTRVEFGHIERVLELKSGRAILPGIEVRRSRDRIEFAANGSVPRSRVSLKSETKQSSLEMP